MASFFIAAILLLVLVLVLLFRPFIFPYQSEGISRRQMNAVIYRDELQKLTSEHAAGRVNAKEYETSYAEIRQRLFQDTNDEDDRAVIDSTKKVIIGLSIFIIFLPSSLYFYLGDIARMAQHSQQKPMTQASVEQMVANFGQKMEKDPGNLNGWVMLGRSYRILGRYADAANAYGRAGAFINNDPELLAEYADALVAIANGNFSGKPLQLINKALKLDPNNLLALWLSGSASFNSGNYKAAIQTWQKLAQQLPPNSEEARAIERLIAEARLKGSLGASSAILHAKWFSGAVELSPKLKSKNKVRRYDDGYCPSVGREDASSCT